MVFVGAALVLSLVLYMILNRYQIETGRTHQIRVHAAANGTPLLGDEKYGDAEANRAFRALGLRRLFLHAASLRFDWPECQGGFQIQAALPTELQSVIETLRKDA